MLVAICRDVVDKSEDFETLASQFKNEDLNVPDLAHEANQGHAFTAQHKGRRQKENFTALGFIALDFDKVTSQEEVDAIMAAPGPIGEFWAIQYDTCSATDDNPRFRLVYPLEQVIYDREYGEEAVTAMQWKAGKADPACKDICHFYYGHKGSQPIVREDKVLPAAALAQLVREYRAATRARAVPTMERPPAATSFDVAAWLEDYATRHPQDKSRSEYFMSLASALYNKSKGDRYLVKSYARDIDRLAGAKYGDRAENEVERCLNKCGPFVDDTPLPRLAPVTDHGATEPQLLTQHNQTDLGNALRMVERFGQDIRYVKEWGWLCWDGRRWKLDKRGAVERFAKKTVATIYQEAAQCADDKERMSLAAFALKSEARGKLEAMISLAESEGEIVAGPEEFDRNPYLLTALNGTINLETGQLLPHRREDMITKLAPVDYDPEAQCPTWHSFLDRIMEENQRLVEFLRRAIGYSLTGLTIEHVMFLMHGNGQNGKSTFLEAIQAMLGDYARTTNPAAFLAKDGGGDGPRNDIAALAGARFVKAVESEKGRRWAEALVKEVTGGDTISARFLYKEEFSFKPAFKLWFAANHKPKVTGQDRGIWRRIRLIPFKAEISETEKDTGLPDKLKAEGAGILAWAVAGCLEWQEKGLQEPSEVLEATASYKEESDVLRDFIADCCLKGSPARCRVLLNELYKVYGKWCADNSEKAMGKINFAAALNERRYAIAPGAKNKTTVFGLALVDIGPKRDSGKSLDGGWELTPKIHF
jgi:P4 family phage/plasmid primase-like protien